VDTNIYRCFFVKDMTVPRGWMIVISCASLVVKMYTLLYTVRFFSLVPTPTSHETNEK
jgi:hypothetical protein